MHAFRSRVGLLWPAVGTVASVAIAIASTKVLRHRPTPWWWHITLPGGRPFAVALLWASVILLSSAWLGLGARLRGGSGARPLDVLAVAALWATPLALGPALFSLDMYSYLAQGALLHHGLDPYRVAPIALRRWHEHALLGDVSTKWRHTTAPYGPLFMAGAALVAAVAGSHVLLGIMLMRALELVGLALVAVFLPRLARAVGADPALAIWLALASPLTLLYLVGGGHNDALMVGLLVGGVTLAIERRPLAAVAVCSLAAAVKLPAIAAVAMIVVCWLREDPRAWARTLSSAIVVSAAVLVGVGVLADVGTSWLSGSLLSSTESAHIALTPATVIAVALSHTVGPDTAAHLRTLEHDLASLSFAILAACAVVLCLRARYDRLVRSLGILLILAAVCGPIAWPWYLTWGAVLLSADPKIQRSLWLPVVILASAFFIMPGGQVAIPLPRAPEMLVLYAVAALIGLAVVVGRRRSREPPPPALRMPSILEARR